MARCRRRFMCKRREIVSAPVAKAKFRRNANFRISHVQQAVGCQQSTQVLQRTSARSVVEIDQDIAAEDDIERRHISQEVGLREVRLCE
jgi:hypothetical protein